MDVADEFGVVYMVQDNFFWLTDPKPCEPKDLPKFDASHELDMKRKRQAEREQRQVLSLAACPKLFFKPCIHAAWFWSSPTMLCIVPGCPCHPASHIAAAGTRVEYGDLILLPSVRYGRIGAGSVYHEMW